MYERFTDQALTVMQLANQEAIRLNQEYIGTEHILLGLLKAVNRSGMVAEIILKNFNVDSRRIRLEIERRVQAGPDIVMTGKLPQAPRAKKVIEYAMEEACEFGHNFVSDAHLLLGLIREGEGLASQVLGELGVTTEAAREAVRKALSDPHSAADSLLTDFLEEKPVPIAVKHAVRKDFKQAEAKLPPPDLGEEIGKLVSLWSQLCAEAGCSEDKRGALLDILGQEPHYKSILRAVQNARALLSD